MKKNLLLLTFLLFSFCSYSQIVSIVPNSSAKGVTLPTVITMATNTFYSSSPPQGLNDIYLQQGATIIYVNSFDPAINVYPGGAWPSFYSDSMHVDFTIPANALPGFYDVHVVTWSAFGSPWQTPFDNVLTGGFLVTGGAGTIEGDVYFDYNQNGIQDGSDFPMVNQRILIAPINYTTYTNGSGHYAAYLDTGTFVVSPILNPTYSITSPAASYSVTLPPSSTGNDFGLYTSSINTDQLLSVWHHPMRCYPSYGYTLIDQTNNGNIPVSGSITMVHSSNMPFVSSNPMPDVISGDTLTWYYTNLQPGATLRIGGTPYIAFQDPPAGQTIWYAVYDSVFDPGNNLLGVLGDYFSFEVTCSCDPNEKIVTPHGSTSQHYVPLNSQLNFTVNFQNTGNDTAFTVVIRDTLDADLDLSTFEVTGSSNPMSTQMDVNGALQFTFDNILLPDSNVDEPGSHGFVNYRISPKTGLPDPTQITNTAHIFFDANSAVVTNTSLSTLTNLVYPSASFNVADPSICQSNCITFSDQSISATSYAWTFQGGSPASSTSANPGVICYNTSGQFDVQLIVVNALGSDTLTQPQYIDVSPSPTGLNVTQAGDTLWANAGYAAYQWFYENDTIQGATGQYYVAIFSGDYGLVVANAGGCTAGLNIPNVISAISELIDSRGTTLYPNPTTGDFELSFSAFAKSNATIEIINSIGQIMSSKIVQIYSGVNRISFDESELSEGIYTVRISVENQTITRQLLKVK
ncbi:MAG: T9SS type A sorting domain-containing protein [Bacteroidetes bacterium]|nr:T9SS type A sorting domain-containing protein [Bacteroidota bacterium]